MIAVYSSIECVGIGGGRDIVLSVEPAAGDASSSGSIDVEEDLDPLWSASRPRRGAVVPY